MPEIIIPEKLEHINHWAEKTSDRMLQDKINEVIDALKIIKKVIEAQHE